MSEKTNKFLEAVAYAGLVLGAVTLLLKTIFPSLSIFDTILNILLFTVVGVKAYNFIGNKKLWVKITYWVSIAMILVLIVLPIVLKLLGK